MNDLAAARDLTPASEDTWIPSTCALCYGNCSIRVHRVDGVVVKIEGNPESAGAAHAMSQSAGGVHDVPHGALTARVLGPVMEFNYAAAPERFARIAPALGEDVR